MPRREIEFQPGSYYHIYNRDVIAFCLMPNHFHLIVCPQTENFSHNMGLFAMSYAKAINSRYRRSGPLFQGRFRAKWIGNDEYLLHLSRYIHVNPAIGKLVEKAEGWEFSSYRDYIGLREDNYLRPAIVLEQFSMAENDRQNQMKAYKEFVEEYENEDIERIKHLL